MSKKTEEILNKRNRDELKCGQNVSEIVKKFPEYFVEILGKCLEKFRKL